MNLIESAFLAHFYKLNYEILAFIILSSKSFQVMLLDILLKTVIYIVLYYS